MLEINEMDTELKEETKDFLTAVTQQQKHEQQALASRTSETLSSLHVSIDGLPLKSQQLLQRASQLQSAMDVEHLETVAMVLKHSNVIHSTLVREYDVLELKQKNAELKKEVERNKAFIASLKQELREVKESMTSQSPNPENVAGYIRETKQKLASYQEVYEKAKLKHAKLNIPPSIQPTALQSLCCRLDARRAACKEVELRADDVTLAARARQTLAQLGNSTC